MGSGSGTRAGRALGLGLVVASLVVLSSAWFKVEIGWSGQRLALEGGVIFYESIVLPVEPDITAVEKQGVHFGRSDGLGRMCQYPLGNVPPLEGSRHSVSVPNVAQGNARLAGTRGVKTPSREH